MSLVKKIVPLAFSAAAALILILFRTVPSGSLWTDYTVLYVPASAQDAQVAQILESSGISDFVSLDNQKVPILLDSEAPETAMLRINLNNSEYSYIFDRENYFYDSSGEYRLYYIPSDYGKELSDALHQLDYYGVSAGNDSSAAYPWIVPILTSLVLVLLFIFSKNRLVFILPSAMLVLFTFCNPFYTSAFAACFVLLCIFFVSNLWKREGSLKHLLKKSLVTVLLLFSVLCAFSYSLKSGIFFLLAVASALLLLMAEWEFSKGSAKKSEYYYSPVFIRPARMVSLYAGRKTPVLSVLIGVFVLLLGAFVLFSNSKFSGHFASLLLPGKSDTQSQRLPDLADYSRWCWNVRTYPLRSLNGGSYDEDYVSYPRFVMGEDGLIHQESYELRYDNSFMESTIEDIDLLGKSSIERLLKIQGPGFSADYTAITANNATIFSIIMMITGFILLLFIYFSAIIRRGGKRG